MAKRAILRLERFRGVRRSDGFVLLLIVLSLLGILGVLLVGSLAAGRVKASRNADSAVALAKAKDALLAYVITRDDPGRPAEFPCPTTVAPGTATYGTSAGSCATVRIGRLPWKTLGVPEILDADGEPLWYAVSNNFRPAVARINSDTLGTLTVYDVGGVATLATQVVAVVFSAGAPVANQIRSSAAALCATTGTSISSNTCAANYLDSGSGWNNATNAGPYIADAAGTAFNDRLVYITTADFIPRVEDRIAALLKRSLANYYIVNGYYPFAANYTEIAWPTELNCANGVYVGRLPLYISASPHTGAPCSTLADWQPVGDPNGLPAWFTGNQWNAAIHYAIGKVFAKGGTKVCATVGDCLTVDTDNGVQALFVLPGIPSPTQTRPSSLPANYLETPENLNEWPAPSGYTYVTSTSALPTRDRVVALKLP